MRPNRIPALCAAMIVAVLFVSLVLPAGAGARAARLSSPCANRLCTKYERGTPSCHRVRTSKRVARCYIARAARHYRQPLGLALHIAWRESRLNWRATNASSGAAGLYQFLWSTWRHTPYRRYSRYNPRWASLAAMWMWKHGGYSHWS